MSDLIRAEWSKEFHVKIKDYWVTATIQGRPSFEVLDQILSLLIDLRNEWAEQDRRIKQNLF
jgi:hypothetical protein